MMIISWWNWLFYSSKKIIIFNVDRFPSPKVIYLRIFYNILRQRLWVSKCSLVFFFQFGRLALCTGWFKVPFLCTKLKYRNIFKEMMRSCYMFWSFCSDKIQRDKVFLRSCTYTLLQSSILLLTFFNWTVRLGLRYMMIDYNFFFL